MNNVEIPPGTTQWDTPTKPMNGHTKYEVIPKKEQVAAFPLEVFPKDIQHFVQRVNGDLGYHKNFTAMSVLGAVSGATGRSYTLNLKPGWTESACLWLCIVGRPGSGKSHPLRSALAPIYRKDKELYAEYQAEKEAFEQYAKLTKADKENTAEPPAPILQKHLISDVTLEALANVLRDNKRGILLHADELKSWLSNFNRYTSGSDTEHWLSIWSGLTALIDRATKDSIRIDNPFVSVLGTTQPGTLERMFKDATHNGLTDRVLFCWPDEIPVTQWGNGDIDTSIFRPYNRVIDTLLNANHSGTNELRFTTGANEAFGKFYNSNQQRIQAEQNESRQSLLSKMDIHASRLSLILQLLRYACGEATNTHVDEVSVRGAIQLVKYFESQAVKVRGRLFESFPVDKLDKTKQAFYDALPQMVKTGDAVKLGTEKYNYSDRFVKGFLQERKLFSKISHGLYERLY